MHVGIVSLGLIGGSIARRLREHGIDVTAWNPSPGALEQAAAFGIRSADSIADLCAGAPDVLILANPLRAMPSVIAEVARALAPRTVLTDVGSVKGPISDLIRSAGLSARFVGGHPMAGTEATGFAAADPRILDDARWALAIEPETRGEDFVRVAAMVTGPLGGAIHAVDPQTHDEAAALISHVPHVVATELLNLVARAPIRDLAWSLAAGSFRDGTRVGHTDPRRTEAMVVENAAWVAPALRVLIRDLDRLATDLENNAPTAEFFDTATELRARKAHAALRSVPVPERDRIVLDVAGTDWRELILGAGAQGGTIVGADARVGTEGHAGTVTVEF